MKKYFVLILFVLGIFNASIGQGTVKISPEYPMRGDSVIVHYHSNGEQRIERPVPVLEFTYTNFYELPQKMEMQKIGPDWQVSFKLPPYAVFATFVINDGDNKVKPSEKRAL